MNLNAADLRFSKDELRQFKALTKCDVFYDRVSKKTAIKNTTTGKEISFPVEQLTDQFISFLSEVGVKPGDSVPGDFLNFHNELAKKHKLNHRTK